MIDEILSDADERMDKSVKALVGQFAAIRSGRAHPSFLDPVELDYYGAQTPMKHVAAISVEGGRTFVIKPFDAGILKALEKAIYAADLGLTPNNNGEVIRLELPPLTEENRRDLIKQAHAVAETARVAVRNIRRDAIHDIRESVKEKLATQDEGHDGEDEAQQLTDRHIELVDKHLADKETDLMEF